MRFFLYKDFRTSLQRLYQSGGVFQKAAQKVWATIGKVKLKEEISDNPFNDLDLTDHGESRIDHCIKYELGGGCRLITIVDNNVCAICYTGKHEDCEKWLNNNRRMGLTVNKDLELIETWETKDVTDENLRIKTETDLANGFLFSKISERKLDFIADGVNRSIMRKFEKLTSLVTDDEIMEICCEIGDKKKENVFFDVFCLLRESDSDSAKNRIDSYINENIKVEDLSQEEIEKIVEGESFIDFESFDGDIIEHLMKTTNYQQWMLFMHPEQKKIVERDFNGPAKLSGVSGSGKTCVLIKRAIGLAKLYNKEKILVLTLNRSLAQLIEELTRVAAPEEINSRIQVKSFWKLCQELLLIFEKENRLLYNDVTWKNGEHIDEIWEEYYQCKYNNFDAEVLWPVHKSLLSRGIFPFDYLKQEFDWVRSALSKKERDNYLEIERKGRSIPLDKNYREIILKGLSSWEQKMTDIGVSDYLNLATALYNHLRKIEPMYRCVLVDEEQDFGIIELKIIRKLVKENENDIFLCGDFAQKVSTKNHSYREADINIVGRSSSIRKNYRNSREILTAAFNVFASNMNEEVLREEDYELLDPEFANYSNVKPLLLKANNFKEELGYSINYFDNHCEEDKKACVAICGLTFREIKFIGDTIKIPVLDGSLSLGQNKLFLSDLEQTKGFEFDYMCILNCNNEVIPNIYFPEEEWYRELSRLYVAMTRAKIELFISFSHELSRFFNKSKDFFIEYKWSDQEKEYSLDYLYDFEDRYQEKKDGLLKITGKEFLYLKEAAGLPVELQEKMQSVISGKNVSLDRRQVEWKTIEDAMREKNLPIISQAFGSGKALSDFKEFFKKFDIE